MASNNLLDTKTLTLNEILGNGKIYRVPQFQRDYSWEQDQLEDLWNDVEIAENSQESHYMGSVVLQSNNNKEFLIIDGQQRFTTLSILTLALIAEIKEMIQAGAEVEANAERVEILMRQYIGYKDPSSLRYSSKLFLNENNNSFYQTRLLEFKEPINERKLSDSEKLLWLSYRYFRGQVNRKFEGKSGADIAKFLNDVVGEYMMFIQITVKDELNAYTVFETLNSRGVELTSADLLKNYLFSLVAGSTTDLNHIKTQWKTIIDTVGLKEFPVFLRYFLLASRRIVTKEFLFKEIKSFVKTGQQVFDLLEEIESYTYTYVALDNSDDEIWDTDKETRSAISILKTFRVTQWKPLAMVGREKLDPTSFRKLLQGIISISYRYNVIAKLQTNDMEKIYSKAAINLYTGKTNSLKDVLSDLKSLYLSDEDFKNYFEIKQFNTKNAADKKLLRYTLYKLEAQETGGSLYDFETDNGTLEHILPESYPEAWQQDFSEEDYERNVYMIGNITLLEPSKNNKNAADHPFGEKKLVYATSKFSMTKKIEDPEWRPQNVKKRQAKLAKLATAVWQVQF
jgi:uncharacterized protein with ParB-like and HNH nuclease domain